MYSTLTATEPKFPFDPATYLASVKRLLAAKGQTYAVEVLSIGKANVVYGEYDNIDGGVNFWDISISVSIETYAKLTKESRETIQQQVSEAARDMFQNYQGHHAAGGTSIVPAMVVVAVANVNNQGGVNPEHPPHIKHDGLKFRSWAEVRLYKAFKQRDVTFAPLALFMRGNVRREPDFFIIKDGFMMLVEVDGPDTHPEKPVEAERRLAPFRDEGVRVERVSASECDNDEDAKRCADRLLTKFERYRAQR